MAYGTAARIAKGAVRRLREKDMKVGLFRPITLWPFPSKALIELTESVRKFLVFEMSMGQMIEDVKLALNGRAEVELYGRPGGVVITPVELSRIVSRRYNAMHHEA